MSTSLHTYTGSPNVGDILDQYLLFLRRCVDPEAYRDGNHLFYIDIEDGPTIDGIKQAKQQMEHYGCESTKDTGND